VTDVRAEQGNTYSFADSAELRQRAAQLHDKARQLTDEGDACAIRAELAEARTELERHLKEAEAAADRATLAAFEAECARSDAQRAADKLRKDLDTFELVKAGSDNESERIQARMVLPAIEAELQEQQIPLYAFSGAALQAQAESEKADLHAEECRKAIREIDEARADPLHHPLAKACNAYKQRIARGLWWQLLIMNAGDETEMEYAKAMLTEVCTSPYGSAVIRGLVDYGRQDERGYAMREISETGRLRRGWEKAEELRAGQAAQDDAARRVRDNSVQFFEESGKP
jgi:hypothetical protein